MSQQPTLFPPAELVSDETRRRWRHHVAFLWQHGEHINEWESGFLTSIKQQLDAGKDLSLAQSSKLGKIFHREEERLG
jgi:hypothetical protein